MAQKNIDWNFILDLEGFELNGYVPDAKNSKSGVTVASGFDLGARNENDLKGLPNNLIKKLIPYLGLKGLEAESVANSLSITENEAKTLNEFAKNTTINILKNKWQNFTNTSFDDLPMHQATVIASLSFQYGNLESETPNFWRQVTNNNWDDALGNLQNFGDRYSPRRNKEAEYLIAGNNQIPPIIPKKEDVEKKEIIKEHKIATNPKKKINPYVPNINQNWPKPNKEIIPKYSAWDQVKTGFKFYSPLDEVYEFLFKDKPTFEIDYNYDRKEDPRIKNNPFLDKHTFLSMSYDETTYKINKLEEELTLAENLKNSGAWGNIGTILGGGPLDPTFWIAGGAIKSARKAATMSARMKKGMTYSIASILPIEAIRTHESELYRGNYLLGTLAVHGTISSILSGFRLKSNFENVNNKKHVNPLLTKDNTKTNSSSYNTREATDAVFENVEITNTFNSVIKSNAYNNWKSKKTNYAIELENAGFKETGIKFEKMGWNPVWRLMNSSNLSSRLIAPRLVDIAAHTQGNYKGIATAYNVDSLVNLEVYAPLSKLLTSVESQFVIHAGKQPQDGFLGNSLNLASIKINSIRNRNAKSIMMRSKFMEEVSLALRQGERHSIPEVVNASKIIRSWYNDMDKKAYDAKLYQKPFERKIEKLEIALSKTTNKSKIDKINNQIKLIKSNMNKLHSLGPMQNNGISYLNRIYDHSAIEADRMGLRNLIVKYIQIEKPNISLVKAHEQADDTILTILRQKPYPEIDDADDLITEQFITEASSSKQRMLKIPDVELAPYLVNDVEKLIKHYARTMGTDIILTKQFGDITLKNALNEITEQSNELIKKAKTPERKKELKLELENNIRDVKGLVSRIRGTFGAPEDPHNITSRMIRGLKSFNVITFMGGATLSSLPDAGLVIMRHGLKDFMNSFHSLWIKKSGLNETLRKMNRIETQNVGQALELQLSVRQMALADVGDIFSNRTKFETALHNSTNVMMLLNGLNVWNTFAKETTSLLASNKIAKLAEKYLTKPLSPNEVSSLAMSGIDLKTLKKIGKEIQINKEVIDGQYIVNTDKWKDANAVFAFRNALNLEIGRTIITPGSGDRALWTSYEWGSLVAQYKSFSQAFVHRVLLRGLQEKDINFTTGIVVMIMIGVLVEQLKRLQYGQELMTDPEEMFINGVDRSGVLGFFGEIGSIVNTLTNGDISIQNLLGMPTKETDAQTKVEKVLGPTSTQLFNAGKVGKDVLTGDVDSSTGDAGSNLIPGTSLPYSPY